MTNGSFGLDKEIIIVQSGLRNVFTPHTPINEVKHFCGREKEASKLVSVINSPGQHILVYGDRGVGKTSLSKTTCKIILQKIQKGKFFEKRCDSSDTFESIVLEPLRAVGIEFDVKERSESHSRGGGANIGIGIAKADVASRRETKKTFTQSTNASSPSWVADKIKGLTALFLIDEVDAIHNNEDKKKIAELIKQLSDVNSKFKIIVVGISKTGKELTAGHPSVERCLKEIPLSRMSAEELKMIIINGMKELKLLPAADVIECIVDISAGYPHFTHLIGQKCAENAVLSGNRHIDMECLHTALASAVEESEGALQRMYDGTLRNLTKPSECKLILLAAAHCSIPEFRTSELKTKLFTEFSVNVDSSMLTRQLAKLARDTEGTILRRVARGVFQFSDPRMPSFIKMSLHKNFTEK